MSLSRKIAAAVEALPAPAGIVVAEDGAHRLALRRRPPPGRSAWPSMP